MISQIPYKHITVLLIAALFVCHAYTVAADEADDIWDLANGLYIRGPAHYADAAQEFQRFQTEFPDDPRAETALFRQGEIFRKQKQYTQALQLYHQHEQYKDSALRNTVTFRIGQMYYFLQKYPEAEIYLAKTKADPNDTSTAASSSYYLGKVYFDSKQYKKAITTLTPLADQPQNPFHPFANYYLAEALANSGQTINAAKRYEIVAGKDISIAAEACYKAGTLYAANKFYNQAYTSFQNLISTFPNSNYTEQAAAGALISLYQQKKYDEFDTQHARLKPLLKKTTKPRVMLLDGNIRLAQKQYQQAITIYNDLISNYPTASELSQALVKLTWAYYLSDNYQETVTAGLTVLADFPDSPDTTTIHFLVAESLMQQQITVEALQHYDEVLKNTATTSLLYQKALFKKARVLFDQKDFSRAQNLFEKFARTYPRNRLAAEALAMAAKCAIETGEYTDAISQYENLLKQYPDHELVNTVMHQLGLLYATTNQHQKLLQTYQAFDEQFPDDEKRPEIHYWLGTAYEETGDTIHARGSYNIVLENPPSFELKQRARYRLAQLYYAVKEYPEAAELIKQVLSEDVNASMPSDTHLWAADYLLKTNDFAAAIHLYKLYITRYPNGYRADKAAFGIGEAWFKQQQWARALPHFVELSKIPGNWMAIAMLRAGVCEQKLGHFEQAEQWLNKAGHSQLPALEAKAHFALGELYLEQIVETDTAEHQADFRERALKQFLKVEILYPKAPIRAKAMLHIADIWQQRNNPTEAQKEYQRIISEYPASEEATQAQQKLNQ